MKQLIIIIFILLNSSVLFAQNANSFIHKGNELYNEQKYKDAEAEYRKSVQKKALIQGNFNLGDALYKQKKFGDAAQDFSGIASSGAADAAVKAEAYHNLGNSMLESKKYQESINAYEKSLLNNPKDNQTRYNLAYAQKMLKKQQQKKNKNNKNKNNKNKNNQNKNQNKPNQNKNNQNKNQQNKNQQNKDQQNQQQPNPISKADAQRMLDALSNQEQATQNKLKDKKLNGVKPHISKDW